MIRKKETECGGVGYHWLFTVVHMDDPNQTLIV
jgi:hypothetical protein